MDQTLLFTTGAICGTLLSHFLWRKAEIKPISHLTASNSLPLSEQDFSNSNWAVVIASTGENSVKVSIYCKTNIPEALTNLSILIRASSALLGQIRDGHPDPDIAAESASLLVHLGIYARQVD